MNTSTAATSRRPFFRLRFCCGPRVVALAVLAWMCLHGSASAATVRISNAPGFPGQSAAVPMELRMSTNVPPNVVALQADIHFDISRSRSRPPGPGGALLGHRIASRETTNGVRRVVLYSVNNTPMTNGTVVRLSFDVLPDNFQNVPLLLTNVVLATAHGGPIAWTNYSGTIFVTPVFLTPEGTAEGFLRVSSNQRYTVQATTDFSTWTTVSTNDAAGNTLRFTDGDASRFPSRFYRAVLTEVSSGLQLGTISQLPGGQVQFDFTGASGRSYVIQASTNLTDWQSLRTNAGLTGPITFTDSFTNFTRRFYRVRAAK